jgi:hypothetical protein
MRARRQRLSSVSPMNVISSWRGGCPIVGITASDPDSAGGRRKPLRQCGEIVNPLFRIADSCALTSCGNSHRFVVDNTANVLTKAELACGVLPSPLLATQVPDLAVARRTARDSIKGHSSNAVGAERLNL